MFAVDFGCDIRPMRGEHLSGDAALVYQQDDKVYVAIVDVLGHGPKAHALTPMIVGHLKENPFVSPGDGLLGLHECIRGSRGAAVGLAVLDLARREFRHAGVGNTVARRLGLKDERFISKDGIVGEIMRTPNEQVAAILRGDIFLFYSDGVREHFNVEDYPSIRSDNPQTVARRVVAKFGRPYDDCSCIAVKVAS